MKVGAAQTASMGVGKGDGARFMHRKYKMCLLGAAATPRRNDLGGFQPSGNSEFSQSADSPHVFHINK